MSNNKTGKASSLAEVVAKAAAEQAKAAEIRRKAEQAEREAKERARKALEAEIAEPREKLAKLREQLGQVETERRAALEAVEAEFQPRIDKLVKQGEGIIAKAVKDTGLDPEILASVGVGLKRPKTGNSRRRSGGRKTVRVGELGEFPPVTVTAPHRRSGKYAKPCTIVLEGVVNHDAPQGYEILAQRIDNGNPFSYTHTSVYMSEDGSIHNNLSRVTTVPGWVETRDAAAAILAATGRLNEFPDVRPVSSPDKVFVDGTPLSEYLK